MRLSAAFAIALLAIPVGPAFGQQSAFDTTGIIHGCRSIVACTNAPQDCRPDDDTFAAGVYCTGLIRGMNFAARALRISADRGARIPSPPCLPAISNQAPFIRVFVAWADKNPNRWHESAEMLIMESMRDAYPCRR